MRIERKIAIIYWSTLLITSFWLGAIGAAPYLRSQASGVAPLIYSCFSTVCHQIPSRSFHLFGFPLAVCARCLGIYAGFLGGLVLYPFQRGFSSVRLPKPAFFWIVSAPIAIDAIANRLGFWTGSNVLRFATGFLWGSILPFYFLTGLGELALRAHKK
ncbi:MAG: DUF2085 domain-containing protein [Candidatus Aminicenantales bacterium]